MLDTDTEGKVARNQERLLRWKAATNFLLRLGQILGGLWVLTILLVIILAIVESIFGLNLPIVYITYVSGFAYVGGFLCVLALLYVGFRLLLYWRREEDLDNLKTVLDRIREKHPEWLEQEEARQLIERERTTETRTKRLLLGCAGNLFWITFGTAFGIVITLMLQQLGVLP